jgi:hypothetical protein
MVEMPTLAKNARVGNLGWNPDLGKDGPAPGANLLFVPRKRGIDAESADLQNMSTEVRLPGSSGLPVTS